MKSKIRMRVALEKAQRAEKKQNEVQQVKEKGFEFPSHNPPPKRKEEMTKGEKRALRMLKSKERLRKSSKTGKAFTGWEYKDRYSHRKTTDQ
jgi:hypothetical protein